MNSTTQSARGLRAMYRDLKRPLSYHEWNKIMKPYWDCLIRTLSDRVPSSLKRKMFTSDHTQGIDLSLTESLAVRLVENVCYSRSGNGATHLALIIQVGELIDQLIHTCENCGIKGREMKKCDRCKHVSATRYCSRNCQREAWPVHKPDCCHP